MGRNGFDSRRARLAPFFAFAPEFCYTLIVPISEDRLRKRLAIREEQAAARDILATKLREKVKAGYCPQTTQEFAGILRMVSDHAKHVGYAEECKDILEKLSEEKPMTIEKYGVECGGDHGITKPHMEKKASGEVVCRHCGARFADVQVKDGAALKDEGTKPAPKDSIEKMLGI